jgi:hypothetical protein
LYGRHGEIDSSLFAERLDNNPTVQTLTGVDESSEGFSTVYVDQLFFYVPGQGSSEKIRLLGYVSNILDAKVIE